MRLLVAMQSMFICVWYGYFRIYVMAVFQKKVSLVKSYESNIISRTPTHFLFQRRPSKLHWCIEMKSHFLNSPVTRSICTVRAIKKSSNGGCRRWCNAYRTIARDIIIGFSVSNISGNMSKQWYDHYDCSGWNVITTFKLVCIYHFVLLIVLIVLLVTNNQYRLVNCKSSDKLIMKMAILFYCIILFCVFWGSNVNLPN